MTDSPATFAAVFIALYIAHSVGDHWVQTSCQAATKGLPGWTGRLACGRHVLGLTLTKGVLLVPVALVLGLRLSVLGLVAGLGIDLATHYWADRRTTLARLADRCGKAEFYSLGTGTHPAHPVTEEGQPAATLGTGAYALDLLCTNGSRKGCQAPTTPERMARSRTPPYRSRTDSSACLTSVMSSPTWGIALIRLPRRSSMVLSSFARSLRARLQTARRS